MPGDLSGKVIVLTGGADGIGYECATAYVREGAAVAVVDRDGDKAQQITANLGSNCMAVQADATASLGRSRPAGTCASTRRADTQR